MPGASRQFGRAGSKWTPYEDALLQSAYRQQRQLWACSSHEYQEMAETIHRWITEKQPEFKRTVCAVKSRIPQLISGNGEDIERSARDERQKSREEMGRLQAREKEAKRKTEQAERQAAQSYAMAKQTTKKARLMVKQAQKEKEDATKEAHAANQKAQLAAARETAAVESQMQAVETSRDMKTKMAMRLLEEAMKDDHGLPAHRRALRFNVLPQLALTSSASEEMAAIVEATVEVSVEGNGAAAEEGGKKMDVEMSASENKGECQY